MYGKNSYSIKTMTLLSSLCIHIIMLCIFFIAYKANTLLISYAHLSKGSLHDQHTPMATLIFQQPKIALPSPLVSSHSPSETTIVETCEPSDTQSKTLQNDTIDLVLPTCQQDDRIRMPEQEQRIKIRRTRQSQKVSHTQLQNLFKAFAQNVQTIKQEESQRPFDPGIMIKDTYTAKLIAFLSQALHGKKSMLYGSADISTLAEIIITFDHQGAIIKYEFKHLLEKEKLRTVDAAMKKLIYSSGLFPPIPQSLLAQHKTFTISLMLNVQLHQGIHTYTITSR